MNIAALKVFLVRMVFSFVYLAFRFQSLATVGSGALRNQKKAMCDCALHFEYCQS
jgi:hypothetical protein